MPFFCVLRHFWLRKLFFDDVNFTGQRKSIGETPKAFLNTLVK